MAMTKLPSASLYVGDLSPKVNEDCLMEVFKAYKFGDDIASIKVCRDSFKPHRSLGYAYVNFFNHQKAELALVYMNNQPILDKPCRIMWSQRDPGLRKSGVGNIFIKNLHESVTHKDLYDYFSTCGNILSCKVALDNMNKSKGFGFVHFEHAEDAQKAIETLNDTLWNGQKIFVAPFLSKKELVQQAEQSWTNVYIKNLSADIDDDQLRAKFEQFGEVSSAHVQKDRNNLSKGFGFVNFTNHEDAKNAVDQLNETNWMDKKIWCGRHMTRSEREPEVLKRKKLRYTTYQGYNLYIKNLDDDIDDARLQQEFSIFGEILKLQVAVDEAGNSKGFGFICFKTQEAAEKAMQTLHNHFLTGCSKRLYINYHEPKEVRIEKLSQQQNAYPNRKRIQYPPLPYSYPTYLYPPHFIRNRPQAWTQHPHNPYYPQYSVPVYNPIPQNGRAQMRNQGPRVPRNPQQGRGRNFDVPEETVSHLHNPNLSYTDFDAEQRKYYLGDKLYPLIHKLEPELCGKITGMLLDSGISHNALHALIGDPRALEARVKEAREVLEKAQLTAGGGAAAPLSE